MINAKIVTVQRRERKTILQCNNVENSEATDWKSPILVDNDSGLRSRNGESGVMQEIAVDTPVILLPYNTQLVRTSKYDQVDKFIPAKPNGIGKVN